MKFFNGIRFSPDIGMADTDKLEEVKETKED
jgi:hypothetical protein